MVVHQQAQIFGEDPFLYDRFRPGLPGEVLETLMAGIGDSPVLEIGAGTGKATQGLLALGATVHALEPDQRMVGRLRDNCASSRLEIIPAGLEAVSLPSLTYGLVVAANSWHWVNRSLAYDRVADALAPTGRLGLVWHRPLSDQGELGERLAVIYSRLAPQLIRFFPGQTRAEFDPRIEPAAATTRFAGWTRYEHYWQRRLGTAELVGWLCTNQAHKRLGLNQRTKLMCSVASSVNEMGGVVEVKMATVAHIAEKA